MESFRFAHPEYLYFLLLHSGIHSYFLYWARMYRYAGRCGIFGDQALIVQLMPSVSTAPPDH